MARKCERTVSANLKPSSPPNHGPAYTATHRSQMALSPKLRACTISTTSEAWNSSDLVRRECLAARPLGTVDGSTIRSLGRRVTSAEKTSAVSLSMLRGAGGWPEDDAPDLCRVFKAASPNARTWSKDQIVTQDGKYIDHSLRERPHHLQF